MSEDPTVWVHALRGVTVDEVQAWADEVATCGCEDCGRLYGDEHGFPDLVVAHDVWEQLMPGREGGGLLCPSCMCLRAHRLGIECEATFRSGPFCALNATNAPSPGEVRAVAGES